MKVLVTGGSGFIGSHVVDKLIEAGHKIKILDIKKPHRDDVEFSEGNILSRDDLKRNLEDIEVVYHMAGFSNIDLVKANPLQTIESNILGTAYLLEECRKSGINRFILASSVYVHNEKGHLYTTSKLTSELLCKNYHTLYSLPYTILRYGTAYGPRSREADVISIFVQRAIKSENLIIYGSGNQKRNFIHVGDIATGSALALKNEGINDTFVLAGAEMITVKEVAEMVKKLFDDKPIIEFRPSEERRDDYQGEIKDLNKAKVVLGWNPVFTLEKGIVHYKEWYLNKGIV